MLLFCDQKHIHWYEQLYWPYEKLSAHNSIFDDSLILAMIAKNFGISFCLLFEIHENTHRKHPEIWKRGTYRGDSLINIAGDVLVNAIGIWIGLRFSARILIPFLIAVYQFNILLISLNTPRNLS